MSEIDYLTKIKQQLVKEDIQDEFSLSHIEPDFYRDVRSFRQSATKEQGKIIDSLINQLVKKRIVKLCYQINQPDTRKIHEFLSDDECFFWESISYAQKELLRKVSY